MTSRISLVIGWMLPNIRWKNILCSRAGVSKYRTTDKLPFRDSATRLWSVLSSTISIACITGVGGISSISQSNQPASQHTPHQGVPNLTHSTELKLASTPIGIPGPSTTLCSCSSPHIPSPVARHGKDKALLPAPSSRIGRLCSSGRSRVPSIHLPTPKSPRSNRSILHRTK